MPFGLGLGLALGLWGAWTAWDTHRTAHRDVRLTLSGISDGDSWVATLGGVEARGNASTREAVFTGVPVGPAELVVRGGIDEDGDGEADRCPRPREGTASVALTVERGDGAWTAPVPVPVKVRCPTRDLGYTMVDIPAGHAVIGSSDADIEAMLKLYPDTNREDYANEQTADGKQLEAEVAAFRMGTIEVTQALWMAVVPPGEEPEPYTFFPSVSLGTDEHEVNLSLLWPDYPAQGLSLTDAAEFFNLLSTLEGLEPAYRFEERPKNTLPETWRMPIRVPDANGYRLPSEVEWEYAARAGSPGPLGPVASLEAMCEWENVLNPALRAARGEDYPAFDCGAATLDHPEASPPDVFPGLAPAGRFRANAWGLRDLFGNVAEWTGDGCAGCGGVDASSDR